MFLILEQITRSPAAPARTCREDFCGCRAGEMASGIPEMFYAFGPQLDAVCCLRKHFRPKLFQFEWCKTLSPYVTDQDVFRCFFYKSFILIQSKNLHMWKINSFYITQQKISWMYFGYSSVSGLTSFPPFATRLRGFQKSFRDRKVKKKKTKWVWPKL